MNKIVAVVCGLAMVAAGAAVAMANNTDEQISQAARPPEVVPASTATLSCPESPVNKQTSTDVLAVAPVAPDDDAAAGGEGEVSVLSDASNPTVLDDIDQRGRPAVVALTPDDRPAVVVRASAGLAPGLAAAQWSTQRKDAGNGLAASLCLPAADEWDFGGISTAVGATTRLVVTNPTPAVAVFDLTFLGPDGKVDAIGARGIALAPQSRESYDLAQFAPGVEAMSMNLTVDSGSVVAAVHTDLVEGNTASGSEWIAPGLSAATEVLVNPGFARGTDQELQIANPTDREALVQVQLVSENGPFTPTKLKDLQIEPFSVLTEDLTDLLDKQESAVHITSTMPVTAAIVDRSARADDLASSGSSPALDSPGVVPVIDDADLTLVLSSAQRRSGPVQITGYTADGEELGVSNVNFKGFRTKTWEPDKRTAERAAYLVVSTPEPIELHAVAQYDGSDGITALPLVPGTYTLSKPNVAAGTGR